MSQAPDRYAVIGNPVAHSKSPRIHSSFAAQTGQHLTYERLLAPLDGFAASVRDFFAQNGRGVNVTLPFKLEAHQLADRLSDRAKAAGAVNTLKLCDGIIEGDNTDGAGLVTDIVDNARVSLQGKRILLLGAGGAARGALLPLLQARPAQLTIANRTAHKAVDLAAQFGGASAPSACEYAALEGHFDVVINATSASLGDQMPPIAGSLFAPGALAYDMMYADKPTVFLAFAAAHGAATRDGLGMLIEQAAEAFYLWRGVRPVTAAVFAELRGAR